MAWSLFLLLAVTPTPSATQSAMETFARRSIVEYNGGDFERALADVKRAYAIQPDPDLLFDLAQCHRALHHWEQAEFFFQGYLREKPNAANRPCAEGLILEMVQRQRDDRADRRVYDSGAALMIVPLQGPTATTMVAYDSVPAGALEASAPRRRIPVTAWALGGSGIAAAIAGAIAWGLAGADRSGYSGAAGHEPMSYPQFQQANTAALLGNILVPVGAVLLATGAGFAIFGSSPARAAEPSQEASALGPQPLNRQAQLPSLDASALGPQPLSRQSELRP